VTIYLYVKTHNKTGLKYLGKTTSKDPHKYKGSGTYWLSHIKKHGYDVSTEIIKETFSKDEITYWGVYYS
jgi:transposase